MCWTRFGDWFISGSEDGNVKFSEIDRGLAHISLEGHSDSVTSVAASPTDSLFVTASRDETVKIWRYKSYFGDDGLQGAAGRIMVN